MIYDNPSGLCQCGCGGLAPIASQTDRQTGSVAGRPMRFIQFHHLRLRRKGYRLSSGGYVLVYQPNHPRATTSGSVFEHILVAEAVVGHFLPLGVVVHHVDSNKTNNVPSNLCILQDNTEHIELHRRRRVRRAGGNPFTDWICFDCKAVKNVDQFRRLKCGRVDSSCRPCAITRRLANKRLAREKSSHVDAA